MRKLSIYVSLLMVSALFGCELSAPPVCLPESEKCEYNSIVHSALYSKCNENGEWQVKTSCSECNGNRCVDSSPEVACETEGESRCDDVANSVSIQFTCKDRQFVPTVCPIGTKCAGTECESASVSCEDESETVCTWVENLKVSVFSFCENGKMTAVYCPEASACDGNVCGRPNVQPTVICSSENGSKCGDDELLSSWAEGVCHNGLCEVLYCIDGYTLINGDCKPAGECCGQDCINCLDKNMVCSDSSANTGTCVETCTDNRVSCQGVCIDPLTSHEYCNAGPDCAHPTKCDSDRICEDGTCVCYPGTECDGTCYDLSVTLNHCGDCETDCTELAGWADGYCMNGLCQATECEPPYQMRTDTIDGENIATCVNDSEVNSCGSDKTDCTTTVEGWVEGECRERRCIVTRCIDGQHPYTTSEESICELNDNDNCGEHAVPCQASSVTASTAAECTNSGECVATSCETGYHLYEGSCEKDDNINCGSHGTACTKDMFEWSETVSCDTGECIIISCDNNHILNGTVCIDKNCTNDATKCMNANTTGKIYKCINNEWVENRICTDNNSCNDTNTDCGVCINDKVQCADLSVQTCANGAWQEPIACTEPTNSKASCSEGVCGFKCNSNYHKTAGGDGCEINSITDCGASHTVCPKATNGSAKCSTSGVCSLYCNNTTTYPDLCSSTCVNLTSDVNNCGSCGNKCTVTHGTAGCSNGSCVAVSCNSNYHKTADGKGCEINTITDCGASHTVCPNATNGSAKCSTSGVCSLYCNNSSYPDLCSSTCVDLANDVNNCGSCGNKCTGSTTVCDGGVCMAPTCGDGTAYKSQTVTTVSGTKTVKAYCIDSTSTLELVRTAINSGSVYPSNNTDNAYILVNNLSYNVTSWTPIGNSSHTFTGIFIGNNKQISFNGSVSTKILVSTSKFGVFGSTSGASIMNLNIDYGVQVDGDSYNYIGGLVGYAGGGYISNVSVYADHKNASLYLGGLVGYADGTTIVNCHTEGYLNGYLAIGGLVGHMDGRMENSYSSCTVNGGQVGGAVGRTNASTSITDCYATGKVTGAPAGGFVGASYNTTYQNCYATGDIKATGDAVGGFVGGSNGESNYYNCYATGDISGEGVEVNVGGFVGDNVSNDTYSYCYAEGEVFGDENVGGFIGSGEGLFEYCAAYGRVVGNASVGGFIGFGSNPQISYSYSHGIVVSYGGASSDFAFGGFAGYLNSGSINHCYEFGRMEIGGSGASPNNGGFIGVILDSVTVHESYYNTVACSEAVGQNSTSNLTGSLGKFTYSTGSHIPILVGSSSTTLLSALSSPYVGKTCTINGSSFPQVPIITEVMSSKYCN